LIRTVVEIGTACKSLGGQKAGRSRPFHPSSPWKPKRQLQVRDILGRLFGVSGTKIQDAMWLIKHRSPKTWLPIFTEGTLRDRIALSVGAVVLRVQRGLL